MKQSDIFSIIIIATAGTLAAYFGLNSVLGDPNERYVTFKTMAAVEQGLVDPDPEFFNMSAINPTVEVYVGTCEDVDQNGILDKAELVACGELEPDEAIAPQDDKNVVEVTEIKQDDNSDENQNSDNGLSGGQDLNNF